MRISKTRSQPQLILITDSHRLPRHLPEQQSFNWSSKERSSSTKKFTPGSFLDLMFTPVANNGGRFVGLDDGNWYYTLGWLAFPVNGQFVFYNDGGQTGTNTMVLHIPAKKLSISFACNRQDIDRMPYVKRLYERVTDQPWDIPVYTKDKVDEAVYKGISNTFNYGSLHFDRTNESRSTPPAERFRSLRIT